MRQREYYALAHIRVNTSFLVFYVMTLILADSTTYALARSLSGPYAQNIVSALGKNIERLRLAHGHENATAFARTIGITAATLHDWESGRYTNLRLDSLLRLARGMPCAVEELIAGVDADYDLVRAESTHGNNLHGVTSPGTPGEVQGGLDQGGSTDATDATATRLSESDAAEVDRLHRLLTSTHRDVIKELYDSANNLRSLADDLVAVREIDTTRPDAAARGRRRSKIRRAAARGGRS